MARLLCCIEEISLCGVRDYSTKITRWLGRVILLQLCMSHVLTEMFDQDLDMQRSTVSQPTKNPTC